MASQPLSLPAVQAVDDDGFEAHRRHLRGLAYRMLGSWADAEDVVQDTWLRWREVDRSAVDSPRAYLSRVAARLCLDKLKSAQARREQYVGPWLPEPLPQAHWYAGPAPGEFAADLSVALMLALERLSAPERAAFLLHDVFDVPYAEIARTLGREEATCRQLAARARARVRETRPRYNASEEEGARLAEAFMRASREGDVDALRTLLAEDAVLYSDGGGRKAAALRPVLGSDRIARFYRGLARKPDAPGYIAEHITRLNGMPAIVAIEPDGLPRTTTLAIDGGRIAAIYLVRNPEKLAHLAALAGQPDVAH